MKFVFRISGGIKCWVPVEDSDTDGPISITIKMEYVLAFQYWYCELVWKTHDGDRKHCFGNFCYLAVFELSVDDGWWSGTENLIYSQLKLHLFPTRILAEATSMRHSDMLYRLDISTFSFYEPLLFQIFISWKSGA